MLFDNLSPKTDFSSKITIQLDILNKNILYVTHECDKIKRIVTRLEHSSNLQKQVDDFMQRDDETSPQTESDEQ